MSEVIRCKLICRHIEPGSDATNPLTTVRFDGVTEQEDAIFGKYTPCANFYAAIVSSVAEKLEVGTAYYFDIQKADA